MKNTIILNNIEFEIIDSREKSYYFYAIIKNQNNYYFLKKLNDNELFYNDSLNMEIDILSRIKSQNVPKIKWFKKDEYIVYDFIVANNLKYMKDISIYDSLKYIYNLTIILEELHNIGYTHNDLKKGNIFVDRRKKVYLLDFGNCCAFGDSPYFLTPSISSPELLLKQNLDNRSDIYSLGVLLHDLIDDMELFNINDKRELIDKKQTVIPLIKKDIEFKDDINNIIFKSANPSIEKRYSSVIEMKNDLEILLKRFE